MYKKVFENLISEFNLYSGISYGKSRVSGSLSMPYYMHSKSGSMPGQKHIFTVNHKRISNNEEDISFSRSRSSYKLDQYVQSKMPIGLKYNNCHPKSFTYKEFSPFDDNTLSMALIASYKQVYGNLQPTEYEKPIDLERRLRNGDITIREFVRSLAKSTFYKKHYFEVISQKECIVLGIKHILGRPIMDQKELVKNIEIIYHNGFESYIDSLVDSLEYLEIFGEDIVPYPRNLNSPCGSRTTSFIKTFNYTKAYASSDNVIKEQEST